MKTINLTHVAAFTLALGLAGLGRTLADDTAGGDGKHWHHDSILTEDERAELKKDRDQVFASNPDLKKEGEDLHGSWKKDASEDEKKAAREKFHAFHEKLDAAIEAIDPNAKALIDKLKAAHHHHHDADNS